MMNSNTIKNKYFIFLVINALMIIVGIYCSGFAGLENIRSKYVRDIAIDAVGMLVGGVLMLGLYAEEKDKRNRAMFRMIFVLSVLFFCDLAVSLIEGNPKYIIAITTLETALFIFEDIISYTYWTYIREELDLSEKITTVADKVLRIVLCVSILLSVINAKFGYYFTISEMGEYIDSPYEFVGDIGIVAIFLFSAIQIIRMKERTVNEKLVLISFGVFPLIAYIIGIGAQEYTWIYPSYMLSILLIYIRVFMERGKKLAEQQVILTKQSTALMISQIQPHFLYNVLTTISNLCATDPEEAEETTVLFSQYLRTNLDSLKSQESVPFALELSHIRTYVELEKKRFGDILNVEYDIKEQNFKVPSLGLQPIVENSIKHGIRGKNAPGRIKISTSKVPNGYSIVIEDDGVGFDMTAPAKEDGRSHVGMNNVRDRLKQMCNASMTIESSPGNGCRTEIVVPD